MHPTITTDSRGSLRRTLIRRAALVIAVSALPLALTACGSTAAQPAVSSSVSTPPSTSSALPSTVTTTMTAPPSTVVTTVTASPAANNSSSSKTSADTKTSTPSGNTNTCPDPATLATVTPNYDPQYPINAINCSGEWAVGTYDADGKNQTTGIWRDVNGGWAWQDRATVCAQADNIPPELYGQACSGN